MSNYTFTEVVLPSSDGTVQSHNLRVVKTGYYLFFNAQHRLIKLTSVERAFFDFLCEEMRAGDNDLTIDNEIKNLFIEHLSNFSGEKKKATLNQLTKYVQKLAALGLILTTQNKGRYIINPKHVFKGSKSARIGYLKKLIEQRFKVGLSIEHLISFATDVRLPKRAVKK